MSKKGGHPTKTNKQKIIFPKGIPNFLNNMPCQFLLPRHDFLSQRPSALYPDKGKNPANIHDHIFAGVKWGVCKNYTRMY
jgi:hypothetical protein